MAKFTPIEAQEETLVSKKCQIALNKSICRNVELCIETKMLLRLCPIFPGWFKYIRIHYSCLGCCFWFCGCCLHYKDICHSLSCLSQYFLFFFGFALLKANKLFVRIAFCHAVVMVKMFDNLTNVTNPIQDWYRYRHRLTCQCYRS